MENQMQSVGRYETENASKYLQQLCKHFGHKVDVDFDTLAGKVAFPMGPATLSAAPNELLVTVTGENADDIARGRSVIDSHLVRFAFREEFDGMAWS